jgi:hypothetical protein
MSSLVALLAQSDQAKVADELAEQFSKVFVPILLGTIFLVVLLVGGLMLYFRRGDKEVNARLREARTAGVHFPGPGEEFPDSPEPTDQAAEPAPADSAPEEPSPTPPPS